MITDVTIHGDRARSIRLVPGTGSISDLIAIRFEDGPSVWISRAQATRLAEEIRALPAPEGSAGGNGK